MTADRISLRGIEVTACHGVYPQEKVTPQLFVVDVTASLAASAAADDLATTVDYARLAEQIGAVVAGPPVDLIETLAEQVAATCLAHPGLSEVEVTVHKPQAAMPVQLADISVTITRGSGL